MIVSIPVAYLVSRMLRQPTVTEKAYAGAWFLLLVFLGLLQLLTSKGGGLLSVVTGVDNRYSTSKVQTAVWTLAIGFGLMLMVALAAVDSDLDAEQLFGNGLKEEYLLLLGGPFGAALVAKGLVTRKVREGQLQKDEASAPSPLDIAGDDDGRLDLADTQYLLFNLIGLAYYFARLLPSPSQGLPEIPATLLGLTTASALGYVTNKAFETNKPEVTSISPSTVSRMEKVEIHGRHLALPASSRPSSSQVVRVLFNGLLSPDVEASGPGRLKATVPNRLSWGPARVTVIGPGGFETEPRLIEVVPNAGHTPPPETDHLRAQPEHPTVTHPNGTPTPTTEPTGYPATEGNRDDREGDDDDHDVPAELLQS